MNTPTEIVQLTDAVEAQVRLLRELAGDLSECRTAYAAMDLDGIYAHVAAQTSLCERLCEAEKARAAAWQAVCVALRAHSNGAGSRDVGAGLQEWISRIDPAIAERLRRALTEMALAEGQVRHLHRAHAVMLEGSRRTIDMLANALAMFSPMYAAPRSAPPNLEARQS
jgi:hypothetical protein